MRRCAYARALVLLGAAALLGACLGRPAPTPAPAPLPGPVSAGAVAVAADGTRLATANPDSDSVTLLRLPGLNVEAEVGVGDDPRTLAFTPDGATLLVASHGAHTLGVIDTATAQAQPALDLGGRPYGVVAGRMRAYVTLDAPPALVVVDLASLTVTARLALEPFPTGLALSADESRLLVTHLYSGRVSVVDPQAGAVLGVVGGDAAANLSQFAALSPDGTRAYLPQTYALADNPELDYNTTVQPMVSVLDVATGEFDPALRLPLAELDRPVSLPFAAAVSGDGARLYVANAGSDAVTVLDLATRTTLAHWPVGHNPRGLALAPDGSRLFVLNALDGTLDVFDTAALAPVASVRVTELPLSPTVLSGKRLFNSALGAMSRQQWVACAACHLDGGADGRTWVGFADGPRATPALFDAAATLPLHWNGNLDELEDVEQTIRQVQFGAGLATGALHPSLGEANGGRSAELDALAAYLATLTTPASPYAPATEAEAQSVTRGERAFRRWGCAICHAPPLYTDQATHPAEHGRDATARFDTPSLRGVWATAPYFHDGSAPTLRDSLFGQGFHSMGFAMDAAEIEDLLAFLRALPYGEAD